jgi:6-phosphogluconolactonase
LGEHKFQIEVFSNYDTLINGAVEQFIDLANAAIQERGTFFVALSGGSTPTPLYQALANPHNQARIPWDWVHLFWGDERYVPLGHPDSNFQMVKKALLDHIPIPEKNVHPVPTEMEIWRAAEHYERGMRRIFDGEWPNFDLVLLGMGEDGHTASLFPHSAGIYEEKRWFIANFAPEKQTWRLTLTKNAINAARKILILVHGEAKATTLADVLVGPSVPYRKPIQLIKPIMGQVIWMIDKASAHHLPPNITTE